MRTSGSRQGRSGIRTLWILATVAFMSVSCGSSSATTHARAADGAPESTTPERSSAPSEETKPIVVDDTYATLAQVAAPADDAGVWAWSASVDDARVWHWSPGGGVTSWSLGSDGEVRQGAATPALAACGSKAWLGINSTLVELDASAGVVARHDVPESSPVDAVDAHRPADLEGVSGIDAVACGASTVAVGRSNARDGFLYDTAADTFTPIALPEAHAVVSAAVNTDGLAAFGLQDFGGGGPHTVVLGDVDGSSRVVPVDDSSRVAAVGTDFRIGVAGAVLATNGGLSSAHIDADAPTVASTSASPTTPTTWMTDGRVIRATDAGLDVTTPGTPGSKPISLGTGPCPEITEPFNPTSPRNTTTVAPAADDCPILAGTIAVDGAGNLYVVPVGARYVRRLPLA